MHSRRDRLMLYATLVVWGVAYVAWTSEWLYGDMQFVFERAMRRIITCTFGACCCWGMKLLLDRLSRWTLAARIGVAVVLCSAGALAYSGVNTLVFYTVVPRWGATSFGDVLDLAELVGFLFFAWTGLYFAVDSDAQARDTGLRLAEARSEALRARNQALAQQINPHFLFNALNIVSGLIMDGEPVRAERVTVSLAALLRRSLDTDAHEFVTLGEEMEAVEQYLDIEQNRFEGRFRFVESVPEELRSFPVPPMILQPLVENAVKHGVARSQAAVVLTVRARLEQNGLKIIVEDDADPIYGAPAGPTSGIGQANVRQRLSLLYKNQAWLHCERRPSSGYCATVFIPKVRHGGA